MLLLGCVVVYLAGLLTVGVLKARRVKDEAAFVLAGRSLTVPILLGTLLATWTGTGSIYGLAEEAYLVGMPSLFLLTAPAAGLAVMVALSARVRAQGRFTLQDILEERFGPAARVLGTLTLVSAYVVIVSYQLRAGASLLERLAATNGWTDPQVDLRPWLLVGVALFVATYTALAGLMSVALTDTFNGILMTVGVLIALPYAVWKLGGLSAVTEALPVTGRSVGGFYTPFDMASLFLPSFLLIMGDANLHQRFMSARTAGTARRAALLLVPAVLILDGSILLLGMTGRAALPDVAEPGRIVLELGLSPLIPDLLGALLMATILAVIVSTADSFLLSSSSSLLRDVYQRFIAPQASEAALLRTARILVVTVTGGALALAFTSERFFDTALFAYTLYGVGITPVLLAALFWPRATPAGAVASMLTATTTALVWKLNEVGPVAARWLGQPEGSRVGAVIPSILVAALVLVGVSLMTKPRAATAA